MQHYLMNPIHYYYKLPIACSESSEASEKTTAQGSRCDSLKEKNVENIFS
jgi:hypothetical protein